MPKNKEKTSKSKRKKAEKCEEIESQMMDKSDENIELPELNGEPEEKTTSKKLKKEKQLTEQVIDHELNKNKDSKYEEIDNKADDKVAEKKKSKKKRKKNESEPFQENSEQNVKTFNLGDLMDATVIKVCGQPQLNISWRRNNESEESETIETCIHLQPNEWQRLKEVVPHIDQLMQAQNS